MKVFLLCLMVGRLVSGNRFTSSVTAEHRLAVEEAAETEALKASRAQRAALLETGGLRARFHEAMRSPRRGARIPQAKVDMLKQPGTFFTDLENSDQFPLRFRQVCAQVDIPVTPPTAGLADVAVNVGMGFIWTWGDKCKKFDECIKTKDKKECGCFMKVEGDVGVGVTATVAKLLTGTVYVNGHLEVSSPEATPCGKPAKAPKCEPEKGVDEATAEVRCREQGETDAELKRMSAPNDEKCGHSYLLRRWLRHYIGKYFYNDEKTKEALFQQLLTEKDALASEKDQMEERQYVISLMKDISHSTATKNVDFFPVDNPLYRIGQILSTKAHDQLIPALQANDFFTKAELAPFLFNRKEIQTHAKDGMLPADIWKLPKIPKEGEKRGPILYEFLPTVEKDTMADGKYRVANLPALAQKHQLNKDILRGIFLWAVRHVVDTTVVQYMFEQSKKSDSERLDFTDGSVQPPPTLDMCSSFPISFDDKFPDDVNVKGQDHPRKVGSLYGAILDGGLGFEFRATPRAWCSMGKNIAKLPDHHSGTAAKTQSTGNGQRRRRLLEATTDESGQRTEIRLGDRGDEDDFSEVVYNWNGRKQLRRKECKLDKVKCQCEHEDCLDNNACEYCDLKVPNWTEGKVCHTVPLRRMIRLTDRKVKHCSWHKTKYWNADMYAIPLWTANVFPRLVLTLQALADELKECSIGELPPVVKTPPTAAHKKKDGKGKEFPKRENGARCSQDIDCASGWCEIIMFGYDRCKPIKMELKDGADCVRDWQCKSATCKDVMMGHNKCAKTQITKGSTNTCLATMKKLFGIFKDAKVVTAMGEDFDSAFGVQTYTEAKKVCPGFSPADVDVSGPAPVDREGTGSCPAGKAWIAISDDKPDKKKGMAFYLLNTITANLEKWAKDNEKTMEKSLESLSAQDAYTVDWAAEISVGTTFGIKALSEWNSAGGSVGFCTPDTNTFQTLTPVFTYASKFGPTVKESVQGSKSTGFSLLFHLIPQLGVGITMTRNHQTETWEPEIEFRVYLSKASFGNSRGDLVQGSGAGDGAWGAMGSSLDGGLTGMLSGPLGSAIGAILTITAELWIAAEGDFASVKKYVLDKIKEIQKNPKKVLGDLFIKATLAGAASYLAALALAEAAKLIGIAATSYLMLVVKAVPNDEGKAVFSAELATLRTVELTLGHVGGVGVKPMIGFGSSIDGGKAINKVLSFVMKNATTNKPLELIDPCAAAVDEARTNLEKAGDKDVKGKEIKKAAKTELQTLQCDEPDRRSKMCKMCCELVARVRPKGNEEKTLQAAHEICDGHRVKKRAGKDFTWFCSGTAMANEYYSRPSTGLLEACTEQALQRDLPGISTDLCEATRMQLKTFLKCNTHSGFFGAAFGNDAGNSRKAFKREAKKRSLYAMARNECFKDDTSSNDPDCFNEAICRFAGIACNEGAEG